MTVLASGQAAPQDIAVDADYVYWVVSDSVRKAPIAGGTVVDIVAGGQSPLYMAIDSDHVYWGNTTDNKLQKVAKTGGAVTTLYTGSRGIGDVRVDNTNVYFSTFAGDVQKVPKTGGSPTTLASGFPSLLYLAIDATYVYYADYGTANASNGTVHRVPIAGGAPTSIAAGLAGPANIEVDASYVYWITYDGGTVQKAPIAGGAVTTLCLLPDDATPLDCVIDSGTVFFTAGNGFVGSVPTSGGAYTDLAEETFDNTDPENPFGPYCITVDANYVYWTNYTTSEVKRASRTFAFSRERIYQALLNRLKVNLSIASTSFTRAFLDFDRIEQGAQPAMIVVGLGGRADRQAAHPARWFLQAMVMLFVRTKTGTQDTPETALYALIEQAETALRRQTTEMSPDEFGTTLGGLVRQCHITNYRIHHGAGTEQAAATLTIEMLAIDLS